MKRRRLASAVAAAIAIPALGLGLNGAASARAISAGFYAKHIVVLDCQGHAHVRPAGYTLACADGNDYLNGLAWTSWGPQLASATGTEHVNDCIPYCAAGHFHSYPVNVVLWAARPPGRGASVTPGSLSSTRASTRRTSALSRLPSRRRCTHDATRRVLPNELAP